MNFRLLLLPFSILYSGAARFRNFLFDNGVLKSKTYNLPVILVGNLSTGGTGKTPHVEYVVRLLKENYRVATLSRGYGRRSSGFVIAGKGVTAELIGDEPMQYYSKFENITVAVCEKRREGIERLMESEKPEVIIMDDGYQHRQVNPGLKILLTPLDHLYSNDFLLPAGDLREPRSGASRANCIVVTRCEGNMTKQDKEKIIRKLHPAPSQQVFFSSMEYNNLVSFFNSTELPLTDLTKRNVILFTGIANASSLETFVKNNSRSVTTLRFPDHHDFTLPDIESVKEKFDKFTAGEAIILTTEKDYNRLRGTVMMKELQQLPCFFIPVNVKIDRKQEFNSIITTYVTENKGHR